MVKFFPHVKNPLSLLIAEYVPKVKLLVSVFSECEFLLPRNVKLLIDLAFRVLRRGLNPCCSDTFWSTNFLIYNLVIFFYHYVCAILMISSAFMYCTFGRHFLKQILLWTVIYYYSTSEADSQKYRAIFKRNNFSY